MHVEITKIMPVENFYLLLGDDLGGGLMDILWRQKDGEKR